MTDVCIHNKSEAPVFVGKVAIPPKRKAMIAPLTWNIFKASDAGKRALERKEVAEVAKAKPAAKESAKGAGDAK